MTILFVHHYTQDDIVVPNEVIKKLDLVGKTPLPICRECSGRSATSLLWRSTNECYMNVIET